MNPLQKYVFMYTSFLIFFGVIALYAVSRVNPLAFSFVLIGEIIIIPLSSFCAYRIGKKKIGENIHNKTSYELELTEEDKKEIETATKKRIESKGKFFNDVSETLFKNDPIGLDFDINIDEYDGEAGQIIEKMHEGTSVDDLEKIIYTVFVQMFDEQIAGDKKKYRIIAEEIKKIRKDTIL